MYKTLSNDGKSKFCGKCKQFVLLTDYHKSSKYSAGVQSKCKKCSKQMADEYKPQRKVWLKAYMDKNREKLLAYKRQWRKEQRMEILEKYGRQCNICGFKDVRALQIDHVNGGGRKHRLKSTFYSDILNDKWGQFQLLCANCNWIKIDEYDEREKRY